jgi:CheY-like chemotaxis protein
MINHLKSQETPGNPSPAIKFLIVDDSDDIIEIISAVLEGAYHNSVRFTANTNSEAMRIALEHIPDLITSDIVRSGGDGYEFIAMLKANEKTKTIPVFALSGTSSPGPSKDKQEIAVAKAEEIKQYQAGFSEVFPKPIDLKQLIAAINRRLGVKSDCQ